MRFLKRLFGAGPARSAEGATPSSPSGAISASVPEEPPWRTAGLIRGRHYSSYVDDIDRLLRGGMLQDAEDLLVECVDATERESKALRGAGVAPVYYGALARLYATQGRVDDEYALLRRYAAQVSGMGPQKPDEALLFRLAAIEGDRGETGASIARLDNLLAGSDDAALPYDCVVEAAKTYFDAGEHAKATAALQRLVATAERRNHATHWMYREWGLFLLGKGQPWDALRVFLTGFAAHGAPTGYRTRNQELWRALGETLRALGVQNVNPARRAIVDALKTAGVDEALEHARSLVPENTIECPTSSGGST